MTGTTAPTSGRAGLALLVVCTSLIVITIDGTILNVALPTLARALAADTSRLQWMADSYTVVFAGLLLPAGSLGDRFGRRRGLTIGLVVFGAGSLAAALAGSAAELIATRAVMGLGAAFVMPATLSIITNLFPVPAQRAKAIAVWAAVAGLGIGIGPVVGGALLEHFYWGSVFLVNIPVVLVALLGGRLFVPESRGVGAPMDLAGAGLSVLGLVALVYGIIEGPNAGWTSGPIIGALAVAVVALAGFVAWEMRAPQPMLDLRFFADPRFSAAVIAISTVFFAFFSLLFVVTQLLQAVLGYDPLLAGVRTLPLAAMLVVCAPLSVRAAGRVGTRVVVVAGLATVAAGLLISGTFTEHAGYGPLAATLTLMGAGMGATMAPATESIMGSLPEPRAGIGAAVNDTTRMVGGALGVAVVGSVLSATYRAATFAPPGVPPGSLSAARASVAGAVQAAHRLGGPAAELLLTEARQAFVHAAHQGIAVAAGVIAVGAAVALLFLPGRPPAEHRNGAT